MLDLMPVPTLSCTPLIVSPAISCSLRSVLLPITFSLPLTVYTPTASSLFHAIIILSVHHNLELRPQRLHGGKFIANLPNFSKLLLRPMHGPGYEGWYARQGQSTYLDDAF
jgi:hypothetical protein